MQSKKEDKVIRKQKPRISTNFSLFMECQLKLWVIYYYIHNIKLRKIMKNQVGSNSRAFQFQFDLQIQKIKLLAPISIPKSSYLQVIWRRGQKNISTKLKPQIKGNEQQIFFGETLSMISTCALNTQTNQFNLKQSIVSAVIYISGSQKLFGSVTINLSSALNPNYMQRGVKFIEEELNGRAKSKIYMKLSSNYLKEMMKGFDQQSIGSGINSNSYNNTSSYSIAERRTLDIPSKDTYSVVSYGGAMRYSAKKDDATSLRREDSAKKLDDHQVLKQYGRYGGYSINNYYAKPTQQYNLTQPHSNQQTSYQTPNLTSNTNANTLTNITSPNQTNTSQQIGSASHIKSITSIQSSANRIPRTSQSQQNRSSAGQQNSRLLIQQQTRRSKLQAEAVRNKTENQQLRSKLTDYLKENMRLKDQLKKYTDNNDKKQAEIKKQNQQVKQKNYILSNEVRELKVRFQKYVAMQKQLVNLKNEKQSNLKQNKKLEENLFSLRKQLQETKSTYYRTKQSQAKLAQQVKDIKSNKIEFQQTKRRQLENKLKQVYGQLQYYQSNCKNLSGMLRECQQKCRNIERQAKNQQNRLESLKIEEIKKMNEAVFNKEKEIKQLTQKNNIKNQECAKYILDAQKLKNQYGKTKDDKIKQLQLSKNKLTADLQKITSQLRDSNNRSQQLKQQKTSLFTQIRNQQLLRSKQAQKTKQAQQTYKRRQQQLDNLRRASQQLQMQNVELNKLLSQKSRTMQQNQAHKEQLQLLMKQNLQLQLQLKYKNQQAYKHFQLLQQLQNLKCKFTIQQGNLKELSDSLEKSQKELKQKNRAYILQCEKSKMLMEERANNMRSYATIKDELEQAKQMIRNGQRQFEQMRYCIQDLQAKNNSLILDVRKLQQKLAQGNPQKLANQLKLESRDNQKIKSIQNLHRTLSTSNKQIKQLQQMSEQRYQQVLNRQKIIQSLQQKIKEYNQLMNTKQQQLSSITQQKNNIAKKSQMIMQQLFSYKKRLEQERGRSNSTVLVRASSQDYIKMKNLQNQLQKKEEKMRKMQKQMMALQSQNVNLSIQVMKKLQDITPK